MFGVGMFGVVGMVTGGQTGSEGAVGTEVLGPLTGIELTGTPLTGMLLTGMLLTGMLLTGIALTGVEPVGGADTDRPPVEYASGAGQGACGPLGGWFTSGEVGICRGIAGPSGMSSPSTAQPS